MSSALWRARPSVALLAPRQIVLGAPAELRVLVDAPAKRPITGLELRVEGEIAFGQGRSRIKRGVTATTLVLCRDAELEPGRQSFGAAIRIRDDLPGSYAGLNLCVHWYVHVRLRLPLVPDVRRTFVVNVQSTAIVDEVGTPAVWASRPGGPHSRKPYLEASIDTHEIEAGAIVRGVVALWNVAFNHYRGLTFVLVAAESLFERDAESCHFRRVWQWTRPVEAPSEGAPLRFALQMPCGLVPGFSAEGARLRWFLKIESDVAWVPDPELWIPLCVRAEGRTDMTLDRAPLAVGSARVELLWREVGRQTGYHYAEGSLHAIVDECAVVLSRASSGRSEVEVQGEIAFPDLGIGLRVDAGMLRVRASEHERWLHEQLVPCLEGLRIVRANDGLLVFSLGDAGHRLEPLRRFAESLRQAAAGLGVVRHQLPPPSWLKDSVEAWRRAADELGARFEPAAARITGAFEGIAFELSTTFDDAGGPTSFLVKAQSPALRAIAPTRAGNPSLAHDPDGARQLRTLSLGAQETRLEPGLVALRFVAGTLTLSGLTTRLERLVSWVADRSGPRGPYRF